MAFTAVVAPRVVPGAVMVVLGDDWNNDNGSNGSDCHNIDNVGSEKTVKMTKMG